MPLDTSRAAVVARAAFPDKIESSKVLAELGYSSTPLENVKRPPADAWNPGMSDVWGKLRFSARMSFTLLHRDAATLWAWYESFRKLAFVFFDYEHTNVTAYAVGTGNGAATVFTIPGKQLLTGALIYLNGVLQVAGYTLQTDAGAFGEDTITFAAAPANLVAITLTGTIRVKYECEFIEAATRRSISGTRTAITMAVQRRFPL